MHGYTSESPQDAQNLKVKVVGNPQKLLGDSNLQHAGAIHISVEMSKLLMKGHHHFKVETDPHWDGLCYH